MANNYTPSTWAVAVLRKLRLPVTPGGVKSLAGWAQAEGGHWNNQARYNPLNTTEPEPGAGNTGAQGNIKVYRDWNQGIDATVRTLKNGRYDGILEGLRAGDPAAVANAIAQSPWGTAGGLVRQTIGAASGTVPQVRSTSSGGTSGGTSRTVTTTTPGVDNSQMRRQLVANFLGSGGVKSQQATQAFASGWAGAQDVLGTTTTATSTAPTARRSSPTSSVSGASGSKVLELIHNDGGQGYGIKDGQVVNGSQVFSAVWAGHANHVHVAAGPKTVVALGNLAQSMGLHVGENPHFGGVNPVHVAGSYHYKGEAIDVSGDPKKMDEYARKVEQYNRTGRLPG